ncbi:site-specific integrase, partial [Escherichia coli]|nr:site-specific integrase [Escherichia coli]MBM2962354.1 site-specific integrase [Escherichia coli]
EALEAELGLSTDEATKRRIKEAKKRREASTGKKEKQESSGGELSDKE